MRYFCSEREKEHDNVNNIARNQSMADQHSRASHDKGDDDQKNTLLT